MLVHSWKKVMGIFVAKAVAMVTNKPHFHQFYHIFLPFLLCLTHQNVLFDSNKYLYVLK